jgi:hypothetical protein
MILSFIDKIVKIPIGNINFALLNVVMMHEQDRRFVERWERQRTNGKWMYGLKFGSVFGFIVFIIINLWNLKDQPFTNVFFTSRALNQLISMVLGGILGYSLIAWTMNEKTYEKIMNREKEGK